MDNIRNSVWGYNKQDVRDLIYEKDLLIDSQQKDIEYLRAENLKLTQKVTQQTAATTTSRGNKRVLKLEQEHLDLQKEML